MHRPNFAAILMCLVIFGSTTLAAACDPLGNAAQPLPTLIPTPLPPSITPPPTLPPTETATLPPTATIPTATPADCSDPTHGQVVKDSFDSKITHAAVAYQVYLPPCYWQTNRRYPYVILLHGSDTDQTEWTDALNAVQILDKGIAANTLPPMILAMPAGGDLANANVFTNGASFESLLITEFMPLVEKNFCTWNAREGRAIGGISRGGFWAYEVAFRHPELFGAVGGHSAFFDANAMPPAYNPLNLAQTIKFKPGLQPRFWLDAGKDDYARPALEDFANTLAGRGIDPGYTMYPLGDHETSYWASHVPEYLAFYGQTWPHYTSDLPSCLQ